MDQSYKVMRALSADPSSGVELFDGYEYFEAPPEAYAKLQGGYSNIEGFRVLDKHELPQGIKFGTKYRTWCVNPPVYLAYLLRKLVLGGARQIRHDLVSADEAFHLTDSVDTVVNCSGFGFYSDPAVFPIRGAFAARFLCKFMFP
jgi:D-amino-acid oxidase